MVHFLSSSSLNSCCTISDFSPLISGSRSRSRRRRWYGFFTRRRCSGSWLTAGLETANSHVLIQLQLEFVLHHQGLLAAHVGVEFEVPAQQVVRPLLPQIKRVLAEFRRRLDQV